MDNLFKNKWVLRIISLLLAVLLWVSINVDDNMDSDSQWFNDTTSEREVMNDVPLEVRFDNDQYVVSGLPQNVVVTVEGPTSSLAPVVRQRNFTAFVDLNDLGPGTHEVDVQHSGISNQLKVNMDPEEVEVTIDQKVNEDFPISVDYINEQEISDEYTIGEAALDPQQVTITGSAEAIERVASVKAIIDVGEADGDLEALKAPVKVYDDQGNELNVLLDPTTVDVSVPIQRSEKEVPVSFEAEGDAADGVSIESITSDTTNVTVIGPNSVLEELEEIENIPVDVEGITEDETVEIEVPVPEEASSVDPETIEVNVEVDQAADAQ
ncbi:YbbR-like domain-containing protein [Halobacillus sp. Marseille-Q1614]|uniref:CdaR family protein n=1 Tax=Halobacillus sp. Marseille-Q1614 TaxID=2709134 RepID=UPI00156E7DCF|nr:CdaR family protein [Halobacillus sp. Marseille-Q1614]